MGPTRGKLLLASGLVMSVACGVTLSGDDTSTEGDDAGTVVPADGSVVPSDDGASGSSSSSGGTSCAALTVFPASKFDFGAVRVATTANGRLVLRNLGTEPITVTATGLAAPFAFETRTPLVVQPTAPANVDFAFSPTVEAPSTAKMTLTWPGCSLGVDVSGAGSNAAILVNPATLILGSAQCGSAIPEGKVTISTTISMTYTASIAQPFTTPTETRIADSTAPSDHPVGIRAFAQNEPPQVYEGQLQLNFAAGGPKTVKVLAEALGGVVNVNNVTLDPAGIATFSNTGNQTVTIKLQESGLTFNPSTFDVAAGAMRNVTVTRTTASQTMFTVQVNVSAGKNCGGTPFFLVSAKP